MPKTEVESKPESKCLTKWEAFADAGLAPQTIICQDYFPAQLADTSCHTRLLLRPESVVGHMNPEHGSGGGFSFHLRRSEKRSPFWEGLKALGVELHDFRCDVCDAELPLVPRKILKHMDSHSGKMRIARQGGTFLMTLRFDEPEGRDDDEF